LFQSINNKFTGYGIGSYPILWHQHSIYLGIDSFIKKNEVMSDWEGNLNKKKQNIQNISASDFMNKNPKIMTENTLAIEALIHMKENRISQVLITNNSNVYLGIVHILDIIKEGINNE